MPHIEFVRAEKGETVEPLRNLGVVDLWFHEIVEAFGDPDDDCCWTFCMMDDPSTVVRLGPRVDNGFWTLQGPDFWTTEQFHEFLRVRTFY